MQLNYKEFALCVLVPSTQKVTFRYIRGAGGLGQRLREFAVIAETGIRVPDPTLSSSQTLVTSAPGNPMPFSGLQGQYTHMYKHTHTHTQIRF